MVTHDGGRPGFGLAHISLIVTCRLSCGTFTTVKLRSLLKKILVDVIVDGVSVGRVLPNVNIPSELKSWICTVPARWFDSLMRMFRLFVPVSDLLLFSYRLLQRPQCCSIIEYCHLYLARQFLEGVDVLCSGAPAYSSSTARLKASWPIGVGFAWLGLIVKLLLSGRRFLGRKILVVS